MYKTGNKTKKPWAQRKHDTEREQGYKERVKKEEKIVQGNNNTYGKNIRRTRNQYRNRKKDKFGREMDNYKYKRKR